MSRCLHLYQPRQDKEQSIKEKCRQMSMVGYNSLADLIKLVGKSTVIIQPRIDLAVLPTVSMPTVSKPTFVRNGRTQNTNESLHCIGWSKSQKTSFVGLKRVLSATCSAVSEFNAGVKTTTRNLCDMMEVPTCEGGVHSVVARGSPR